MARNPVNLSCIGATWAGSPLPGLARYTLTVQPDEQTLNNMVAEEFAKTVGPLTPADKDDRLINKMKMLEASMMDKAWLYRKGKRAVERSVKIRAGLEVKHRLHKATGGLIRADYALEDGKMKDVCISGDFFLFSRQCRRPFGGPAGRVHVRQHRKCDC